MLNLSDYYLSSKNGTFSSILSDNNNGTRPADQVIPFYWTILLLLVNVCGAIGSAILLLAIAIHKPLRRSSSCALLAHCIALDLYATAIAVPVSVIVPTLLGPAHPLPNPFCKYSPLFVYAAIFAATWASTILALNRLVAAILPRQFAHFRGPRAKASMLIIPWIAAAIIALFPTAELGLKMVRGASGACTWTTTTASNSTTAVSPITVNAVFGTYLPLTVTGMCYTLVLVKTALDLRRRRGSRVLQRRLELSRTLFLSLVWECLALLPSPIALAFFQKAYFENLTFQLVLRFLYNGFRGVNPLFFWTSSRLFQAGTKELLTEVCGKCRPKTQVAPMPRHSVGSTSARVPAVSADSTVSAEGRN
ncbi:hypothetical protein BV898_14359 [Hypsibius exemplaris]|uniref:G-protein coupled receptors family 1 profile domain-containing protein n=1 Tax=Hypsibius exemplaris TaxID=2072580 RepID=A0A9X6NI48_HYPEX|nr:hypothetical protein BV898_14359 [Hypsibius exemplaris]